MKKLVYLASPHSDPNPIIREVRYQLVMAALAQLMVENAVVIYSPIVHTHELAKVHALPKTFEFWRELDLNWLDHCDEIWVLCIEGWDRSVGVKAEIAHMRNADKTVRFFLFVDEVVQEIDSESRLLDERRTFFDLIFQRSPARDSQ